MPSQRVAGPVGVDLEDCVDAALYLARGGHVDPDRRGITYAYLAFEGEGHGFRMAANIERAREAEFYFYSRVLDFDPADDLEPVEIVHEDAFWALER